MPATTVNLVWSMFFLKGSRVLFQVALTALALVEEQCYEQDRFDMAMILIQEFAENELYPELLFDNLVPLISEEEMRELKTTHTRNMVERLQK